MDTTIIFSKNNWIIAEYINQATNKPRILIESTESGFVDYPIRYDNGTFAYDFPEKIPQYIKEEAEKIIYNDKKYW